MKQFKTTHSYVGEKSLEEVLSQVLRGIARTRPDLLRPKKNDTDEKEAAAL